MTTAQAVANLVGNNQTLPIGGAADAPFLAFGDDSQYKGALAFAYVVIPRGKAKSLQRQLSYLKKRFRFPPDLPVHCRVLFSGDQREKKGLGHLRRHDPPAILAQIVGLVNEHRGLVRFSHAQEASWKQMFAGQSTLELHGTPEKQVMAVNPDPKGVLGVLAQSCWALPPDRSQGPIASDCQIFAATDNTPISFMGDTKRRADGWIKGYSDIGAPAGHLFHIVPSHDAGEYAPLFEIADVAAYICSHAIHGQAEEPLFFDLLQQIKWRTGHEFSPLPESALGA